MPPRKRAEPRQTKPTVDESTAADPAVVAPEPSVDEVAPPVVDEASVNEVPAPEEASPDLAERRAQVAARDGMVRALLAEREGLAARDLGDRIAQVDEQLELRGYPTGATQ